MFRSRLRSSQEGSIALLPVVTVFLSITAFLGVMWYALPSEKKTVVNTNVGLMNVSNINTNTTVNTNSIVNDSSGTAKGETEGNINTAVNTNTAKAQTNENTNAVIITNATSNVASDESNIKNPIKKVTTITNLFPKGPEEGFRRVNVMGDKALIAGGKYLYLYDSNSQTVTDLSDKLLTSDPNVDARIAVPGGIANNGKYWILSTTRVGERVHLYTFDGTTWTDLTNDFLSAVPNSVTGGLNFAWNGSYWLIGHNPGHLVKYDGTSFTDLYSQIPNPEGNVTFMDIDWNGSYFMFTMLGPGNHGRVYRYDGTTFTRLTEISPDSYVTTLGWNGSYWLISGFNGQHMLKYDGTTITDTNVGTRQQAMTAWVKSKWLISGQLFDGETLDPISTVLGGFDISVGDKFGIALNYQSVQRFDF